VKISTYLLTLGCSKVNCCLQQSWVTHQAPPPEAVNWFRLQIGHTNRFVRTVLMSALSFLLVFFWAIPVIFASGLANVETLTTLLPFLKVAVSRVGRYLFLLWGLLGFEPVDVSRCASGSFRWTDVVDGGGAYLRCATRTHAYSTIPVAIAATHPPAAQAKIQLSISKSLRKLSFDMLLQTNLSFFSLRKSEFPLSFGPNHPVCRYLTAHRP
jgi:hypothetical protein